MAFYLQGVCVSYWSMLLSKLKLLLGLLSTSGGRAWMETENSHDNGEEKHTHTSLQVHVCVHSSLTPTTFQILLTIKLNS